MESYAAGILKRENVKMAGQRRLGLADPGASPSAGPRARIVEQDDNGATIEVTCPCGRKIHLRCMYAAQTE